MKKLFHQFYRFTDEEFKDLWHNSFFAFDANVLLNLYRYSESTTEQLLSLLERLSERIVIPYQFALEFQRNRVDAITEQVKNYREAEEILKKFDAEQLKPKRKHPFLSEASVTALSQIQNELETSRRKHEALFSRDPYLERITGLIRNVSAQPSDLKSLHAQAKERYTQKIPPGYEDIDKSEPECFGDCLGWLQLIEISKELKRPAVLVSDDAKEDWWQIRGGRTIGPRPELKDEFLKSSSQIFHMYSSDQFMTFANTYLAESVTPSAIEEVKEHLDEVLRSARPKKPFAASAPETINEKPISDLKQMPKEERLKSSASGRQETTLPSDIKPLGTSQSSNTK